MPRVHLFEFHDQPWLPAVLRDALTGYLVTVSRTFRLHERLAPVIERALEDSDAERIVDLCSGSGGPILDVTARLTQRVPVVLTDKFPSRAVFASVASDDVIPHAEPVDAEDVPAHLTGLRTVINAFHHFRPDAARRLLANATTHSAPIAVVEFSERTLVNVLASPLIILMTLVVMPFVRPTRWQYWVFCYLIPILSLMAFWDGLVSHLRTYSRTELAQLTGPLDDYVWRCDRIAAGAGLNMTVLVGIPKPREDQRSE